MDYKADELNIVKKTIYNIQHNMMPWIKPTILLHNTKTSVAKFLNNGD